MCSYNGARTLGRCLDALATQTVRDELEVVVVDDGSTDGTAELARAYDVVLVVHEENRGISAARNSGISASRGEVVAFTDDDCAPRADWVGRLLAPYARSEVAGVGGATSVARVETWVHRYLAIYNPLAPLEVELATSASLLFRLALYLRRMWSVPTTGEARAVYSFPGANMSFRREVLDRVGGFDPEMRFGGDDEHICRLVRELGPRSVLWFVPEAEVLHDYVGTLRDVWRRNSAYGRGHARAFLSDPSKRWPILFPAPAVALGSLAMLRSGSVARRAAAVVALSQVLFPQGLLAAARDGRPADLAFGFVRFVEESAHDAGIVSGIVAGVLSGRSSRWAVAGRRRSA